MATSTAQLNSFFNLKYLKTMWSHPYPVISLSCVYLAVHQLLFGLIHKFSSIKDVLILRKFSAKATQKKKIQNLQVFFASIKQFLISQLCTQDEQQIQVSFTTEQHQKHCCPDNRYHTLATHIFLVSGWQFQKTISNKTSSYTSGYCFALSGDKICEKVAAFTPALESYSKLSREAKKKQILGSLFTNVRKCLKHLWLNYIITLD